jgi:hypothetical protein
MRLALPHAGPAPRPRAGRHVRRTAPRVGLVAALALGAALVVLQFAGPLAGAVALTVAILVLFGGVCRLVSADDADVDEDRWLRQALDGLGGGVWEDQDDEDEDPDLLVY